jgi:hypothetical protein
VDDSIVEVGKSLGVGDAIKDHVYEARIRTRPAGQAKGHPQKLVTSPQRGKGRLGLVLFFELNHMESPD